MKGNETRRRRSTRAPGWLIGGALIAAVVLAYLPALGSGLLAWDDMELFEEEIPSNPVEIWTGRVHKTYLPVTFTSLWLDRAVWGGDRAGLSHLVNVLLHGINALLVLALASRILGRRDLGRCAALVFALHPLATESVAWIAERKGLLAFLFSALSILAFLGAADRKGAGRAALHALGTLALLAALLSKGSALVVPLVLAAFVVLLRPRPRGFRWCLDLAPYFIVAAALGALHYDIALEEGPARSPGIESAGALFATGLPVLARYVRLAFVPLWGQSLVPDVRPVDGFLDGAVLAAIPVLVLLGAAIWLGRRDRVLLLGLGITVAGLAPYNNLLPRTTVLFAERYLYVSLFGAALVAARLLARTGRWRPVVLAGCSVLLGALTFARCTLWHDGVEVFRDAERKAGVSYLASSKLADALKAKAESLGESPEKAKTLWEECAEAQDRAIRAAASTAEELGARMDRAGVLIALKRYEEVLLTLEPAEELRGRLSRAEKEGFELGIHMNRGTALLELGRSGEAVLAYRAAAMAAPEYAPALSHLCSALSREALRKEGTEAEACWQGALAAGTVAVTLDPDDADAAVALAEARYRTGKIVEARKGLSALVARQPGAVRARVLLGEILLEMKRPRDAMRHLEAVVARAPGHERARIGLASAELVLGLDARLRGSFARAAEHARRSLTLWPGWAEAPSPAGEPAAGRARIAGRLADTLVLLADVTEVRDETERLLRRAAALPGGRRARVRLASLFARAARSLAAGGEVEGAADRMRAAVGSRPSYLVGEAGIRITALLPRVAKATLPEGPAADLLLLGIARLLAGEHPEAVRAFADVSDATDADAELHRLALLFRGRSLTEAGDLEEAEIVLGKLAERHPADPWPWILLAGARVRVATREEGRGEEGSESEADRLYDRAVAAAKRAVDSAPGLLEARLRLGEAYLAAGRYDEALMEFLAAGREHEGRVEPHLDLADLYKIQYHIHGGRYNLEAARKELRRALEIDPDEPRALASRGEVRYLLGSRGGDLDLRRAIQEDPSLAGARAVLAAIYLAEGRSRLQRGGEDAVEMARNFAQRAVPLTRSADPLIFLAEIARKTRDFGGALVYLERAALREVGSADLAEARALYHRDLGWARFLLGHREKGLAEFRKAIAVGSDKVDLHRERVLLGLEEAAPPAPEADRPLDSRVEKILAERTAVARRRFLAAAGLYRQERYEEAEAEVRASLTARVSAEGKHLLGLILSAGGLPEAAERAFASAVREKPTLARAWLDLGDLRYVAGDLEGAISAYEGFLRHAGADAPAKTRGMVEARIREMRGKR